MMKPTNGAVAERRFKGRTVAVVNDLKMEEQWFLYCKTRELKEAIKHGEDLTRFKVNDPNSTVYTLFLEDSTRTKESFRNAAEFHGMKVNVFDAKSSSFQKNETITDTVKMLVGYSIGPTVFVIRTKVEGVCRWLEEAMVKFARQREYPTPSFINAGDGRHEHPTQEFLDEFSFLEHKGWDCSSIHLALIGDLMHGRTIHSKVDGLKIYGEVHVDLIAPPELGLPEMYKDRMRLAGFTVCEFASIQDYLEQPKVSKLWYFTRLQLERMGDKVRDSADNLRKAVTFRRDFTDKLPPNTKFFHPLPRDAKAPELPFWLDGMDLNGWDQQSQNGYFTRIVLTGMLSGALGDTDEDYKGTMAKYESDAGRPRLIDTTAPDGLETPDFRIKSATWTPLGGDVAVEDIHVSNLARVASDFAQNLPASDPISADEVAGKEEAGLCLPASFSGIVLDCIAEGQPSAKVWSVISLVRSVLGLHSTGGMGVYRVAPKGECTDRAAGFISVPHPSLEQTWDRLPLKRLAAMSPGATLTVMQEGKPTQRLKMRMPPKIYNFSDISCKNTECISHPGNAQREVSAYFLREEERKAVAEVEESGLRAYQFSCKYCERVHSFWEIWDLQQHQAALM